MRAVVRWLSVAVVLGPAAWPAPARLIENWSYDRLFKEADLVVIAEAQGVADADDAAPFDHRPDLFEAQTTTFTVGYTLKAKAAGADLKVLHFRLKKGVQIENGPMLVTFRTKPIEVELKDRKIGVGKGSYLLFLKARKDGRYEPVSGQYDPALSVRELNSPLIKLTDD
jgi:hypothetical protein